MHPWCECFLGGHWIACEALFDRALYEGARAKGILREGDMPNIGWDGRTPLCTTAAWIAEDLGTHASRDDAFRMMAGRSKVPRLVARVMYGISNRHTQSIRRHA